MERHSRQVGTFVVVLRATYVHVPPVSATAGTASALRRQSPHVRIVPVAWLNQAVFEGPKCRKCTIRTSYSASASSGEADEPRPAGARGEGVLGFPDRGAGSVGAPEDGLLQNRPALVERLPVCALAAQSDERPRPVCRSTTRTVDPFLTMRSETVAVGCHWLPIGLVEPFSAPSHLRPVATGCAR
jgi:hypothetical protein